jgi:hypothetical protein
MLRELLRWVRPGRAAAAGLRWREWARALSSAHGRVVGGSAAQGVLALVPATPGSAFPARPGARSFAPVIRLSPQINLSLRTVAVLGAPVAVLARPATRTAMSRRTEGSTRAGSQPLAPAGGSLALLAAVEPPVERERQVVTRIVERFRRVELPPRWVGTAGDSQGAATPSGAAPSRLRSGLELPGVVERSAPWPGAAPDLTLPRRPSAESGQAAAPAPLDRSERAFPDPEPPLPRVDVERLTDEVVRQIDRRIVAHRERQGRI